MSKCGALTKAGTKCKNPAEGCRWHTSTARKSPSTATKRKMPSAFWDNLADELRKAGIGTEKSEFSRKFKFDYSKLDVSAILEFESLGAPTGLSAYPTSVLYQHYFPQFKKWSAEGLERAVKSTLTIHKIDHDLTRAVLLAWDPTINRKVMTQFIKAGVTRNDVAMWYTNQFTSLFLSSIDIIYILTRGELVSTPSLIREIIKVCRKSKKTKKTKK